MERQYSEPASLYLYNNRWLRNYLREQEHMDMESELTSTEYDRDLYRVAAEVERRVNIQRGNYNNEDELSDFEDDETTLSIQENNDSDMDSEILDIMGTDDDDSFNGTTESFDINGNVKQENQSDKVENDTVSENEPADENVNNAMLYNNPLYQFALIVESVHSR